MNTEIVTPQQARQIARRLFLKLYPDQEDWFDLAWGCYARLGVQTESGVKLANLPGLGAVAGTDPLTENTINYFVSFANAFLIEHPIALGRLLERYSKESKSLPTPISDPDISDVATRVLREGPQSPSVPLALGSKDERQARQTSQNKESTEKRADDLRGLRTNANIVWVGMLTDLIGHEELVGLDGYRFFLPKTFLRCFQVAAFEECNEGDLYCYVGQTMNSQ